MKKFDVVFRGYDKDQVHKCLDDVIKNVKEMGYEFASLDDFEK